MAEEKPISGLEKRMQMRSVARTLSRTDPASRKQKRDYSEILIEHLREKGHLVCVTDDQKLIDTLRDLVLNMLKMPASCLLITSSAEKVGKLARQAVESGKKPLFLLEQNLNGRDMTFVTRVLKTAFPEIKVFMVASETSRNRFALLHESGVDACLVKPLDGPALLEKLALAVRPADQVARSLDWARVLLSQGEPLRALQVCTQALEQQTSTVAILLVMGDIFRDMKEYDKAIETLQKCAQGSPMFMDPMQKLAEVYGEKGDLPKQLHYLERLDEISPLNLERKLQIGELLLRMNQGEKARKMFDQAMKLSNRQAHENISGVAYRVADLYMEADPVMAAAFLRRGLDARKEFWGAEDLATFNRLGLLLRRSGKWQEAVEEYRKALTVAPNDDTLQYNLGMAFLEGKQFEPARAAALKALALNPDLPRKSSTIASNLAAAFMGVNDRMHALPLLRISLEQDPANAQARELVEQVEKGDA